MTQPRAVDFRETDLDAIAAARGRIVVISGAEGRMDKAARRVNRLTRGALARYLESDAFRRQKEGTVHELSYPAGLAAEGILVLRLERRADSLTARRAGAAVARAAGRGGLLVLAGNLARAADLSFGIVLASYRFDVHRTRRDDEEDAPAEISGTGKDAASEKGAGSGAKEDPGPVTIMVSKPEAVAAAATPLAALAEGIFFTRDLVNEPANILTTTEFAARLAAMQELGLAVEILEEDELEKLGMGALLAVGQGSQSPSRLVVMQWRGRAGGDAPLALVGKGVVFDTGGISLKPARGMEDMTMDMGGAAVVAGVMRTLALRRARADVVGIVGLVENMPDGRATRPGDIVRAMKGDTIEVINTDAEGRLVLADALWYAQKRFNPCGVIDLATLTGAIIIALGHEKTGVFSNDDSFCEALLKAAEAEGEGAWRMPLGEAWDRALKSDKADMKNVGGRDAGAITAAQFLQRFIRRGTPWAHLDIAGTAQLKKPADLAPKGATGWGVMALDRLIRDHYEG